MAGEAEVIKEYHVTLVEYGPSAPVVNFRCPACGRKSDRRVFYWTWTEGKLHARVACSEVYFGECRTVLSVMAEDFAKTSQVVDVYRGARPKPLVENVSFPPGAVAGQVCCPECDGTGWWGFGPEESVNGVCIICRGTGRVWVGL